MKIATSRREVSDIPKKRIKTGKSVIEGMDLKKSTKDSVSLSSSKYRPRRIPNDMPTMADIVKDANTRAVVENMANRYSYLVIMSSKLLNVEKGEGIIR